MNCPKCHKEMKETKRRAPTIKLPYFEHKKKKRNANRIRTVYHCDYCYTDYVVSMALIEINIKSGKRIKAW